MAVRDFTANQIRTAKIIMTGSSPSGGISHGKLELSVYSESVAPDQLGGNPASPTYTDVGNDVSIFVSGSQSAKDGVVGGQVLFGGDTYVSGTLTVGTITKNTAVIAPTNTVFNKAGLDIDFTVEGSSASIPKRGAILVDGGTNQVVIQGGGTSAAASYGVNTATSALPAQISTYISGACGPNGKTPAASGVTVIAGDLLISGSLFVKPCFLAENAEQPEFTELYNPNDEGHQGASAYIDAANAYGANDVPLTVIKTINTNTVLRCKNMAVFEGGIKGASPLSIFASGSTDALVVSGNVEIVAASGSNQGANLTISGSMTVTGSMTVSGSNTFTVYGPSIFNADQNANNDFQVKSATNANMLYVDSSTDRVGIGIAAPLTTVHVKKASGENELRLQSAGAYTSIIQKDNAELIIQNASAGPVIFYDDSAETMRIARGGTVTLAGDLIVKGATTTVSSSNLVIQDSIIGLGFSGSSDAGAIFNNIGDRAIIFGRGSAATSALPAINYDGSNSNIEFATFIASPSSGSMGAPQTFIDLSTGNINATGFVTASMGLSGSLTRLTDGRSYLVAGTSVTITSASNGQVTVSVDDSGIDTQNTLDQAYDEGGTAVGAKIIVDGQPVQFEVAGSSKTAFAVTGSVFIGSGSIIIPGPDTNFFVSGTIGSKGTSIVGTSVFGGDVVISGTLHGGSPLTIGSDILPSADDTHDIGSATAAWQDLFLEGDFTFTDAGKIVTTAGNLTIEAEAANAKVVIKGDQTSGTSIHIDGNEAAGSIVDIDAGILDIDVTAAATIDAVGIALGAGSGELDLTTTGLMDINSAALDIDTSGAITIDAAGTASHIAIVTAHTAGVAFHLDADANAGSIVDIDAGILDIDAAGAITLDGTGISLDSDAASNFTTSVGSLSLIASQNHADGKVILSGSSGNDSVHVTSDIQIDGKSFFTDDVQIEPNKRIFFDGASLSNGPFIFGNTVAMTLDGDNRMFLDFDEDLLIRDAANTVIKVVDSGAPTGIEAQLDANIVFSGSIGSKDSSVRGTAVFGGDVVISGTLHGGSPLDVGADINLIVDGSKLAFGVNNEITFTHVHDVGLTITNTNAASDNKPVVLQLKSEEDVIVADDVIGSLEFAAGDGDGTDAADVAAGIHAIAEGTFGANANATKLVFTTGVQESANSAATPKMVLDSSGNLTLAGELQVTNIGYTDGDNAIVIANGGGITAAAGITSTAAANSLGATSFNDADITNVGVLEVDTVQSADDAVGLIINFDGNTEKNVITLKDNLTDALLIKEDANLYMKFDTTNTAERIAMFKGLDLVSDGVKVKLGVDGDVVLQHNHDKGVILKHNGTADDKPMVLTLQTGEADIQADDVIASIEFQAPDEASANGDNNLVAASIAAVSEGNFSNTANATKLSFRTAKSEDASLAAQEKMSIDSGGSVIMNAGTTTAPGAGFDGGEDTVVSRIQEINGVTITSFEINIDDQVSTDGTGLRIMGDSSGAAAAHFARLDSAVNGLIYKATMVCTEAPVGGETDLDIYAESAVRAEGASISGNYARIIEAKADHVVTKFMSEDAPFYDNGTGATPGLHDYYLYIVNGTGGSMAAGTYSAGKFFLQLYGIKAFGS